MEQIIFLLATSFAYSLSRKTNQPKRYLIGNTTCSVKLLGSVKDFETSVSENGDITYFNQSRENKVTYGVICIQLFETDHTISDAGILLTKFMHSLHLLFQIQHNTGAQFDQGIKGEILTVTDYWQDKLKMDWKVKGLTNGKFIAVLYVKNINESDIGKTDAFLESLTF